MRLLLDECIGDRSQKDALVAAGHDVARSVDELGGGVDDLAVFAFAREHQRIVITYNNVDFKLLGEKNPDHPGMTVRDTSPVLSLAAARRFSADSCVRSDQPRPFLSPQRGANGARHAARW